MNTSRSSSERPRRLRRGQWHLGPVVWIAVLLVSWIVIVDWRVVPELVTATMAAIP